MKRQKDKQVQHDAPQWEVHFRNAVGLRVVGKQKFWTCKAAILWCKRQTNNTEMVIHGPNGEVHPFTPFLENC